MSKVTNMAASIRFCRLHGGGAMLLRCRRVSSLVLVYRPEVRWSSSKLSSNEQVCLNIVKKQDFDNYLCTLLLPEDARAATFATRAFNVELASVMDNVSERMIGKMRMQFWREVINEIYQGSPRETPVVKELYRAVVKRKLSKRWFTRIIDSRDANLEDKNYRTLSEVEEYAEQTSSSLLYLTLESLGLQNVHADHAASHIGKSQGIVTLLRATPYHASRRKVYLPMELLVQHGLPEEQIIRGKVDQKLKDVIYEIASQGHVQLQKARSLKKDVPRKALPALLATVPIANYLKKLQKADFNVFHPSLQQRNTMLPFSLWVQSVRKTY